MLQNDEWNYLLVISDYLDKFKNHHKSIKEQHSSYLHLVLQPYEMLFVPQQIYPILLAILHTEHRFVHDAQDRFLPTQKPLPTLWLQPVQIDKRFSFKQGF